MDTIEDKLSRLAQTKSDIRNALLKTGIAVPADAKFSDYITKILEAPCYKFPDLPGDVTRWSFKGLTNEQMSKNPRLEDADHKGRFLTFKNFAWGGMSGCSGYTYNFREWISLTKYASNVGGDIVTISSDKVKIINATVLNASHGVIKQTSVQKEEIFDFYVNITGLSNIDTSNNPLTFGKFDNPNQFELKDGINHVQYTKSASAGWVGFGFKKAVEHCDVTIELLPSYPGFIIGDGVDDYAVTEKNFDFQDTYTVYTAFIPFKSSTDYPALCGKDYKKDFYINFRGDSLSHISFYSVNKALFSGLLNGFNLFVCKRTANKIVIKNLITGASKESDIDSLIENPGLYYLWKSAVIVQYSKAAIAGQVICNGHFTSDEEDTKVLNWYKKEYPWLFFDQAWTVVGKSNEDTDRATIANITGNGNDLILSNFGFAEGSGYNEQGEYAGYLVTDGVDDKIVSSVFGMGKDFTIVGDWKFIDNKKSGTGLVKGSSFYIYNTMIGLDLYINSGSVKNSLDGIKSINAACSDGRAYDRNWNEILANTGNVVGSGSMLEVSNSGGRFDRIAFKNLAIYPRILSKDDCIKAYNYLQTLKAK